jgi:hypothetical protein
VILIATQKMIVQAQRALLNDGAKASTLTMHRCNYLALGIARCQCIKTLIKTKLECLELLSFLPAGLMY